jgi:hypothetical protein
MAQKMKCIETRSWPARYVGPIAIHAAQRFQRAYQELCEEEPFRAALLRDPRLDPRKPLAQQLPRGKIVAFARLDRWEQVTPQTKLPAEPERSFGNYALERYLFHFTHLHPVEPFSATGGLGLWPLAVPDHLLPVLPELGEASMLLAQEQVPTLIVDDLREVCGKRQLACRLATEDRQTGLAHLHRMAQLLRLKPEWFQGGESPHYVLYGERKRAGAIMHGARPVSS